MPGQDLGFRFEGKLAMTEGASWQPSSRGVLPGQGQGALVGSLWHHGTAAQLLEGAVSRTFQLWLCDCRVSRARSPTNDTGRGRLSWQTGQRWRCAPQTWETSEKQWHE